LIPRPNLLEGETLPAIPRQRRSIEKRLRLKSAALALFAENGYSQTSIEEIADRAGLAVGTFYQHFRSKRQLLLALMEDLLLKLSRVDIRPKGAAAGDVRAGLHTLLERAFTTDLEHLGAYRAWQELVASDPDLAVKQGQIRAWTTARVFAAFSYFQHQPGARQGVNTLALAEIMDSFFWNLLSEAVINRGARLQAWIQSATHLIYHALFNDANGTA
jgi:AcrR family transcriptional regulator